MSKFRTAQPAMGEWAGQREEAKSAGRVGHPVVYELGHGLEHGLDTGLTYDLLSSRCKRVERTTNQNLGRTSSDTLLGQKVAGV